MALVTVQVGQCGNQVGREFLSAVAAELQQQPPRTALSKAVAGRVMAAAK